MPRRRNPTDAEKKLLVKLSKKSKGLVDFELMAGALAPYGWRFVSRPIGLPMTDSSVSWGITQRLKTCADYFRVEPGQLMFRARSEADCARQQLPKVMQIVASEPSSPEVGSFYATAPSDIETSHGYHVFRTQIWKGGIRWTATAPGGATKNFATPDREPINLGPFWTFAYKNGLDKTAAAALSPEDIAEAGRTKAERDRIEMQRSALPEVAAVFREITDARYRDVIKYIEEMLHVATKHVLSVQDDSRIKWEGVPFGTSVQRLMRTSYDHETRRYLWEPKENYEALLVAEAKRIADETRESFVLKNTAKISEIANRKGSTPTAKLLSIGKGYGGYGGEICFSFPDTSSFILRNKTVWKVSPLGVVFAQFPTTFHDVVMPDGKKMGAPSEARMLDVFSRASENNPRGRTSSHERGLAARLARG